MCKSVNRAALVIVAKKPFRDWANYIIHETPVPHFYPDPYEDKGTAVYLIPDNLYEDAFTNFVMQHYTIIFEEQLAFWLPEEEHWPQNRSWDVFCDWFDIIHVKGLLDFSELEIKREALY